LVLAKEKKMLGDRQKWLQRAKKYHVRGRYQCLNLSDLKTLVSAIVIQRRQRRKRRQRKPENDLDCFTLDPVSARTHTFFHYVSHSPPRFYCFEPRSLFEYFVQTGQLVNPFTRTPFSEKELQKLEEAQGEGASGRTNFHAIQIQRREERAREETLQLLYEEATQSLEYLWRPAGAGGGAYGFEYVMQHMFQTCHVSVPDFLFRIMEIETEDHTMAYCCLMRVLCKLLEVTSCNTHQQQTLYSMAQRNSSRAAYNLLYEFSQRVFGAAPGRPAVAGV
jgi:hypothetical protein